MAQSSPSPSSPAQPRDMYVAAFGTPHNSLRTRGAKVGRFSQVAMTGEERKLCGGLSGVIMQDRAEAGVARGVHKLIRQACGLVELAAWATCPCISYYPSCFP